MQCRRPLISTVLAIALLAGQWLAAGHESEHSLQPGTAHACAICVFAHGASAGALPAAPVLPSLLRAQPIIAAASGLTRDAVRRSPPIRGPPSFLV